ncbi:/ rplQ / 50S ribosomal protein L17 /:363025 Reverse [Candidatus Hepatoplasma crinochetorum]|uniref:50S ribosomal protein L17 n=1 Tax=Candidatus Hepatoplasma crinochetorum TaxID=295596 RepID=A0A0G7ZL46_9MOLU|nr:/ rplQ / 50S ribosomal protein L17 /:363025 Reverse [Candidatus Hepatoplasma crinochetorum]
MANKNPAQRQSNVHDFARTERIERNQLTDLVINEKLITNHAKAKNLQKKMDRLITIAKKDDVNARRRVAKVLRNVKVTVNKKEKTVIQKLFEDIAPKYKNRNGGYTRVLKYGNRKGDNSPVSIILFT